MSRDGQARHLEPGEARRRVRIFLPITLIAVTLASAVALGTRNTSDVHPDEWAHVDAFRYFEYLWWPPDLGSYTVTYSDSGWSRVFTGEVAYPLFGRAGRLVRGLSGDGYRLYRLMNVLLLPGTLLALFLVPARTLDPARIGMTMVCIPQIIYIYGYANSDAFGLSVSLLLLLVAVRLADREAAGWSWRLVLLLGLLGGLVATSKPVYLFSLFLPAVLVGSRVARRFGEGGPPALRRPAAQLAAAALLALAVAAPLQIVYPRTQGDWAAAERAMREARAREDFKPSHPDCPTFHLAEKGETYRSLLTRWPWARRTAESFYATFGYMSVRPPAWVYLAAAAGTLLGLMLTATALAPSSRSRDPALGLCLLLCPVVLAANTFASLHHSLTFDFQAQGRYLFASIVPVSLMVMGPGAGEGRRLRAARWVLFVLLFALSGYTLMRTALAGPALR